MASERRHRELLVTCWKEKSPEEYFPNAMSKVKAFCICAADWQEKPASILLESLMRTNDQDIDLATFNTMLRACATGGQAHTAVRLMAKMEDLAISPDVTTYISTALACAYDGHKNRAKAIVEQMVAAQVPADMARRARWERALKIQDDMKAVNLYPSPELLDHPTFGRPRPKVPRSQKVRPVKDQWEAATVVMDDGPAMVEAAAVLGDSERALKLLSGMVAANVSASVETVNSAMGSSYRADGAAMVEAAAVLGDWERAVKLLNDMVAANVIVSVDTFNSALDSIYRADKWKRALDLFAALQAVNVAVRPGVNQMD